MVMDAPQLRSGVKWSRASLSADGGGGGRGRQSPPQRWLGCQLWRRRVAQLRPCRMGVMSRRRSRWTWTKSVDVDVGVSEVAEESEVGVLGRPVGQVEKAESVDAAEASRAPEAAAFIDETARDVFVAGNSEEAGGIAAADEEPVLVVETGGTQSQGATRHGNTMRNDDLRPPWEMRALLTTKYAWYPASTGRAGMVTLLAVTVASHAMNPSRDSLCTVSELAFAQTHKTATRYGERAPGHVRLTLSEPHCRTSIWRTPACRGSSGAGVGAGIMSWVGGAGMIAEA